MPSLHDMAFPTEGTCTLAQLGKKVCLPEGNTNI